MYKILNFVIRYPVEKNQLWILLFENLLRPVFAILDKVLLRRQWTTKEESLRGETGLLQIAQSYICGLLGKLVLSGPSEGLKIWGCQYYLVGKICPLGWDKINWSAKIWGEGMAPPTPPGTTDLSLLLHRLVVSTTTNARAHQVKFLLHFYIQTGKPHVYKYI